MMREVKWTDVDVVVEGKREVGCRHLGCTDRCLEIATPRVCDSLGSSPCLESHIIPAPINITGQANASNAVGRVPDCYSVVMYVCVSWIVYLSMYLVGLWYRSCSAYVTLTLGTYRGHLPKVGTFIGRLPVIRTSRRWDFPFLEGVQMGSRLATSLASIGHAYYLRFD
ncbi:hypothetical protein LX36DRAFT_318208 [Colletotrichum falcatum]|nr:hypothetical protein LX36DRAFT_318208 [Colletotrichum falcatum]